jgi:hypothetical protein
MTETEWLAANEPGPMLKYLSGKREPFARHLSLRFILECCRVTQQQLNIPVSILHSLESLTNRERQNSTQPIDVVTLLNLLTGSFFPIILGLERGGLWSFAGYVAHITNQHGYDASTQAIYLRDIIGNPFRQATFDPEWRSAAVVALAESITNGDHSHYPILADALLDAGCRDETVLDHCRQSGPHFKHCWVIEGLLKPHADPVGNG